MNVLCANWKTLVRAYKKCRKTRSKTGLFVFSDNREAQEEFREALRLFVSALDNFVKTCESEI
jgi:hypothetical protein